MIPRSSPRSSRRERSDEETGTSGVVLALVIGAAAGHCTAAAAVRFVPADPRFVVANVREAVPDAGLRTLIAEWRSAPDEHA